jgi:type IV secretion system protein VirB6
MSKFWSVLVVLFCLSACSGDRCIEADDFGFANFVVSSRYTKAEMSDQSGEQQVAPWRNSNYRVNGRPLVVLVRGWTQGSDRNNSSELSAWCAWYGANGEGYKLARFCERLQECIFIDGIMCTDTKDAQITNAPCIFTKGVGLYALIAARETDPNDSFATQKNPQGITFHLGEPTVGYEMLDIDKRGNTRTAGGLVYKYEDNDSLKREYEDGELYFKILDKFYDDNSGQYRVTIKSGITNTSPDPITFVTNLVKNFLFGADGDYGLIRNIYKGIVNNPGYRMAVSALLSFYIMWTALSYLAGNVQITHTELIVRVMKIAVVSTLLSSEYSWTFFNDYLFVWFVGGVEQILQMIIEAGATGPGSASIMGMMIAPQTLSKLFSLLFIDWMGFIYIILFFFALYFVIIIFFDAAIIYLTALIAIGMIITMGPIFICFMLFGITRSLFENWLRQLISYAVQPIILFTGLVFISMILRQEIYGALGFRICKHTFPKMSNGGAEVISDFTKENLGFDLGDSIFYWWFPQPMKGEQFSRVTRSIPIPIDHFVSGDNVITGADAGSFCEAYGCVGQRYVDLPFLDPVRDQRRISQFWNGKFVQLDGMLLIFVAIYLLDKFNGTAVSIAKFISGSSGNLTDIQNVANKASDGIKSRIDQLGDKAKARFAETKVGRKVTQIKEMASAHLENIKEAPSKWVDERRIKNLKQDALSSKPNAAVVAEVRKSTGLDHRNVKKGAIGDYTKALKSQLKGIDSTLTDKQASKMANAMSHKNFKELENEFAKAKYGKDLSKLNEQQKNDIKNIVNGTSKSQEQLAKEKYGKSFDALNSKEQQAIKTLPRADTTKKSLVELAADAEYSRKYAESYVDAYQALSNRGVGLLGKQSSVIRSLEEINHKAKTKQELTKAKEQQIGEELYAGYENLKHGAFTTVAGRSENETVKALGNTFAGGAWNNIDTSKEARNYRMQTYNEQLADRSKEQAYQPVAMKIESLSKIAGESVISPEFIARAKIHKDPKLEVYSDLARQQVKNKVYQELASGEDPVLRGDKFMKEYAKDSEMVHMIDKAERVKAQIIKDDPLTAKESNHELLLQKAEENIKPTLNKLEEHYKMEIPQEKLPEMLAKYNVEKSINPKDSRDEVEILAKSLKDFRDSQNALQEIYNRKQDIVQEVDKHVSGINEHRTKAGMQEYIPPKTDLVGMRSKRTIDDLRKKK